MALRLESEAGVKSQQVLEVVAGSVDIVPYATGEM